MPQTTEKMKGIRVAEAFYLHCLAKKGGCSYEAESLGPVRFCPRCGRSRALLATRFPVYRGECRCGATVTLIDAMEPETGRLAAQGKGFCPECGREFELVHAHDDAA